MNPSSEFSMSSPFSGLFMSSSLRASALDELLSKPDVRIEKLLDNDDFLFKLKNSNPRLLDYFIKNRHYVKQLVDYIIKMPPEDADENRAYKYPFMACEIFESDIPPIMNAFFLSHRASLEEKQKAAAEAREKMKRSSNSDDFEIVEDKQEDKDNAEANGGAENKTTLNSQESGVSNTGKKSIESTAASSTQHSESLLEYAFSFLETEGDEPLNPVLSGYFAKLLLSLFRRQSEQMIDFMYEDPKWLHAMVKHLGDRSICEILPVFLCYENLNYDGKNPIYTEIKLGTIDLMLKVIQEKAEDFELIGNVTAVLNEIIIRNDSIIDGKEMASKIIYSETVKILVKVISGENNLAIQNMCTILRAIVAFYTPIGVKIDPLGIEETYIDEKLLEADPIYYELSKGMEVFAKILSQDSHEEPVRTSFGAYVKPIGSGRLKLIEIIERIIRLKSASVYQKLSDLHMIKNITSIFEESLWNNILHSTYEKFILTILDGAHPILLKALFEDAELINVILRITDEEDYELPNKKRKVRKGYLGHAYKIANEIQRNSNINDIIRGYTSANPNWEKFVTSKLKQTNDAYSTEIGGYNPRNAYPEQEPSDLKVELQRYFENKDSENKESNENQFNATSENEVAVINQNGDVNQDNVHTIELENNRLHHINENPNEELPDDSNVRESVGNKDENHQSEQNIEEVQSNKEAQQQSTTDEQSENQIQTDPKNTENRIKSPPSVKDEFKTDPIVPDKNFTNNLKDSMLFIEQMQSQQQQQSSQEQQQSQPQQNNKPNQEEEAEGEEDQAQERKMNEEMIDQFSPDKGGDTLVKSYVGVNVLPEDDDDDEEEHQQRVQQAKDQTVQSNLSGQPQIENISALSENAGRIIDTKESLIATTNTVSSLDLQEQFSSNKELSTPTKEEVEGTKEQSPNQVDKQIKPNETEEKAPQSDSKPSHAQQLLEQMLDNHQDGTPANNNTTTPVNQTTQPLASMEVYPVQPQDDEVVSLSKESSNLTTNDDAFEDIIKNHVDDFSDSDKSRRGFDSSKSNSVLSNRNTPKKDSSDYQIEEQVLNQSEECSAADIENTEQESSPQKESTKEQQSPKHEKNQDQGEQENPKSPKQVEGDADETIKNENIEKQKESNEEQEITKESSNEYSKQQQQTPEGERFQTFGDENIYSDTKSSDFVFQSDEKDGTTNQLLNLPEGPAEKTEQQQTTTPFDSENQDLEALAQMRNKSMTDSILEQITGKKSDDFGPQKPKFKIIVRSNSGSGKKMETSSGNQNQSTPTWGKTSSEAEEVTSFEKYAKEVRSATPTKTHTRRRSLFSTPTEENKSDAILQVPAPLSQTKSADTQNEYDFTQKDSVDDLAQSSIAASETNNAQESTNENLPPSPKANDKENHKLQQSQLNKFNNVESIIRKSEPLPALSERYERDNLDSSQISEARSNTSRASLPVSQSMVLGKGKKLKFKVKKSDKEKKNHQGVLNFLNSTLSKGGYQSFTNTTEQSVADSDRMSMVSSYYDEEEANNLIPDALKYKEAEEAMPHNEKIITVEQSSNNNAIDLDQVAQDSANVNTVTEN